MLSLSFTSTNCIAGIARRIVKSARHIADIARRFAGIARHIAAPPRHIAGSARRLAGSFRWFADSARPLAGIARRIVESFRRRRVSANTWQGSAKRVNFVAVVVLSLKETVSCKYFLFISISVTIPLLPFATNPPRRNGGTKVYNFISYCSSR